MKISVSERNKSIELIQKLTPTASLYKKYEKDAINFIADYTRIAHDIPIGAREIFGIRMAPSKLFKRKYLIAFVTKNWFDRLAAHCNAIASPSLSILNLSSPPLVIIPGKSMSKAKGFSSIVEHEFVHVNQGIYGRFPNLNECELRKEKLFDELINMTHAEFEANFIQLVHDKTYTPNQEFGISLEKWCLLRGYTQGLEAAILRITMGNISLSQNKKFLNKIRDNLENAFTGRNLNKDIGHEFAQNIEQMSKVAMLNLLKQRPEIWKVQNYTNLFNWIFRKENAERGRRQQA